MNYYDILFAKKLAGEGGGGITPTGTLSVSANGTYDVTNYASADVNVSGGGSAFTLLNTITVSEDVRGVNVDVSAYGNDYDFFFIYIDFTLSSSDWLYFVRNGSTPSGGTYVNESRTGFKGFCSFMVNTNLFSNKKRGVVGSQSFSINSNTESYDYNNLYIYTYSSSKSIKSGSIVKIYGGKYADL